MSIDNGMNGRPPSPPPSQSSSPAQKRLAHSASQNKPAPQNKSASQRKPGQRPVRPQKSQAASQAASQAGSPAKMAGNKAGSKNAAARNSVPGLGAIMKRNEYYRDGYRSLQRIALIQSVVIIGLILAMFFVINVHQPENRYFATTEDGRLVPMITLRQPNLSNPALLSWVAQGATEIMTFGFHDYEQRLQEASRYFTKPGWASFAQALKTSRIIETVQTNQQVVTAAPRSAPIILSESVVEGRYQWVVQMPMKLTFQSGSKIDTRNWVVVLSIVRMPQLGNPNGLGIQQWIARSG